MPPAIFVDLDSVDLNQVQYDVAAIEKCNPHRFEMRLLDGITMFDPDNDLVLGYKDTRSDEFWVRGHIPGRPLFPGVLMIEAAAQLASFYARMVTDETRFIGFGGVEDVKFRHQIVPEQRLYIAGKMLDQRPRRFKFATQGFVEGKMAFEAIIIGMPM